MPRGRLPIYSDEDRRLRKIMHNIELRCKNPMVHGYAYYGGRGIEKRLTLLELAHLWYRDKASDMLKPSIDRKNSDGHYELANCRFIEMRENKARGQFACSRCGKSTKTKLCSVCKKIKTCKNCGEARLDFKPGILYCERCWIFNRGPCLSCGEDVLIERRFRSRASRSNKVFCNRRCFGKWVGQWRQRAA